MAEWLSDPPAQDLCTESIQLDQEQPHTWRDPWFRSGPADVPQTLEFPFVGATDLVFRDFELSGVFVSSSEGGPVDRVIEGAFSTVTDIEGLLVEGLSLQDWSAEDVKANEECAEEAVL